MENSLISFPFTLEIIWKLTTENPFLMILTARKENGKLARPNVICILKRFIRKYPINFGNNLK